MKKSGPSAILSWDELACKDGTPYPERWRLTRAVDLSRAFGAVRSAVGLPIVVLSGYRTAAHNASVGGTRHSQHVEGRALDLLPPRGWDATGLAAVVRSVLEIRGVGVYPTFVHMDIRPSDRVVVWAGRRSQADSGDDVVAMR